MGQTTRHYASQNDPSLHAVRAPRQGRRMQGLLPYLIDLKRRLTAAGTDAAKQMRAFGGSVIKRAADSGVLQAALRPALTLAAAFFAGGALLPGGLSPFGAALVLAVPQPMTLAAAVGCVLGGVWAMPALAAVRQTATVLTIAALRLLLRRGSEVWAGLAGVAVYAVLSQAAMQMGVAGAGPAHWLVQGLLTLALGLVYREAAPDTLRLATPRQQAVALAVWASFAAVMISLPLPGQALGAPLAGAAVCAAALLASVCGAPAMRGLLWAGAALATLATGADAALLGVRLAAVWCAAAAGGRRRRMAAVFFTVGMLGVFAAQDLTVLGAYLAANAAAGLVFCLVPARGLFWLQGRLTAGTVAPRPVSDTLHALADGLAAVAGGLETVGRAVPTPQQDPNSPVETACRQVCSGCVQKARCWGAGYDATQQAMQSFLQQWRRDAPAAFPNYFLCVRAGAVRTALLHAERLRMARAGARVENANLRRTVAEQYRALAEGLTEMADQNEPVTPQPQLAARAAALAEGLALPVRQVQAASDAAGRPQISLQLYKATLGHGMLKHLSAALGRLCGQPLTAVAEEADAAGLRRVRFAPAAPYTVCVGVAHRALEGPLCGDVTEQFEKDGDRVLLLCDGMGAGRTAALDARLTALFCTRLVDAGFAIPAAARLVNAQLAARAPGDRGSTLDALRLNAFTGAGTLYKAGASPSYLCTEAGVTRLGAPAKEGGSGLPLGGMGAVQGVSLPVRLATGQRLVLVSDGVLAAGEAPLLAALQTLEQAAPQAAAQTILEKTTAAGVQDDCTVAVVQLQPQTASV